MKLKLKYKIFIILLSSSTVIIACMFFFTNYSFEKGLISYVDKMEMNRLELISNILEQEYENYGNWKFLKDDPEKWFQILRYTHRKLRYRNLPPYDPPFFLDGKSDYKKKRDGRYGKDRKKNHGYSRYRKFSHRPDHIILLDKDKKRMFVMMDDNATVRLKPVIVHDKTVGWLGFVPPKFIVDKEELVFFKQQSRTFLMIAVLMTLISVIVTLFTVYYLEVPSGC